MAVLRRRLHHLNEPQHEVAILAMDEIDTADRKVRTNLFGLDSAVLAAVVIYVTIVAAAYVRFGTLPQVSFGVVAVLVLPFIGLATRSKEFMKSSALIVAVLLTYESLQGITGTLVHSGSVVSLAPFDQALVGSLAPRQSHCMRNDPPLSVLIDDIDPQEPLSPAYLDSKLGPPGHQSDQFGGYPVQLPPVSVDHLPCGFDANTNTDM